MNNFYKYRMLATFAAFLCLLVWMIPAKAQDHPFTLTTWDEYYAHNETLYWIESNGATGFYMIPMEYGDDKGVSTSNMPNENMLWFFIDAGSENSTQYYYIGNKSTGRFLRLKGSNGSDNSIGIKAYVSEDDSYKFSVSGSAGQWVFSPKSGSTYYVNKKGSNVNYLNGLKSSTAYDANSKWKFVAKNDVTWTHPFVNSTNEEKHYYLIQNKHSSYTSFYLSIDASSYVTVSNVENNNRIWYFEEASTDGSIPNMKYYYIVNAETGNYMYFNGTANGNELSDVFKIQAHSSGDDDRYQFAIVNAVGTSYSAYSIMPKKLIGLYQNKYTSLGSATMSNDERTDTRKDRGTDNNDAHWGFVATTYSAEIVDPVITCNGEFITITCDTYGADIYYRLNETGSYSLYSTPIVINANTTVEAYSVKNALKSNTVSEHCIAIKSYKFAGLKISSGPLYYGSNGYEIKNGWNHNSYNSIYGKTIGSTYFNFIELGQLFESSVFSTSDGDIEKVLDPLDGWRLPTKAEWASILGTTRDGSTVNDASNIHYAIIELTDVSGLLIFPDGETITGVALSNMDNATINTGITESQLDEYLSQGCIFLPGSGYYDGSLHTWNNENYYYWSSTENNSSTGFDLCFGPSISSNDNKDKESYYFPVYLVKATYDEATKLLKTWTYNNHEVELPYSINAIDGHSASYAKGTFNFTTDVKVKALQPTYLWFQHADQSAAVYVDNTLVEKHWGGYNAFFVDISDYVHYGINNIKVAIKNNEGNKLAPCAGDFNFNATLGEVKLISSPVVPSPDYGYDGFHITSTVTAQEATITVKTSVPTEATVTCSINGTNCDYTSTQTDSGVITFSTTITNPHLWNGTLDPYLYDVTLTIAKDGVVYHKFQRGYGFRFYEYAVDTEHPENSRFLLNGSPYLLRGVCMHSDLEGKANALTAEDIDNDFELLKDLGCNFVRLAHYPHPKEVYDWCDKLGIIVQTEAPWVNNAQSTQPSDYYTHLEGQYIDMVNQHYNHPSIIFWGLSNETTTDNKDFAKDKINGYISLIKNLDSSRLVGYVMSHSIDDPSGYYNDPDADWFGCNIYVGWYIDKTSNNPTNRLNTRLNKTLTRLGKPMAFSEYGCGGTQSCHSDDFMNTTTSGNNPRHDIEYQMWLHEGHIAAIKNFPQLLFTSQWQLFDIAVSNRNEGYTVCLDGENTSIDNNLRRLNNKGLVERDHKTKKDTYYLYKAWWNQTDKFVHICGKDYEKYTDRVIKCYTNDGNTLSLYVNDAFVESVTVANNIATFAATTFHPGDVIRVSGATTNDTFTITNIFRTDGNWGETANWSCKALPVQGCDVIINAECTIPDGVVARANNITIGENGSLTIANGGQLILSNNTSVQATVQNSTKASTETKDYVSQWNAISSPVNNVLISSFVQETHNVYRYDEETVVWQEYRNSANAFAYLQNGRGYIYRSTEAGIEFTGDVTTGDANGLVTCPDLSYACENDKYKGFNLIGNPFTHDITWANLTTTTNISDAGFFLLGANGEWAAQTTSGTIAPMQAFMIQATAADPVVKIANSVVSAKGNDNRYGSDQIQFTVNNSEYSDVAYAIFKEGYGLNKIEHRNSDIPMLYIIDNNQDFAIAAMPDNTSVIDLGFNATKMGQYTLSVKAEGNYSYMHLFDKLTGNDIDMLLDDSYTFIGSSTDRKDRFVLRLNYNAANIDTESDIFAYQSGSDIIVSGEGELQIFDITGRQVMTTTINGVEPISVLTQGVYILRLVGTEIKTQKIVVR